MDKLIDTLNEDTIAKFNALEDEGAKELISRILNNYTFCSISYLNTTFLRDWLKIDLNRFALCLKT